MKEELDSSMRRYIEEERNRKWDLMDGLYTFLGFPNDNFPGSDYVLVMHPRLWQLLCKINDKRDMGNISKNKREGNKLMFLSRRVHLNNQLIWDEIMAVNPFEI